MLSVNVIISLVTDTGVSCVEVKNMVLVCATKSPGRVNANVKQDGPGPRVPALPRQMRA